MNIQPSGDFVPMKTASNRHIGYQDPIDPPRDFIEEFGRAMQKSVNNTNDSQIESEKLNLQMAVQPDSVNVHDVMIAGEKAQLTLDFTRNVLQRVVSAYQSLTNLR